MIMTIAVWTVTRSLGLAPCELDHVICMSKERWRNESKTDCHQIRCLGGQNNMRSFLKSIEGFAFKDPDSEGVKQLKALIQDAIKLEDEMKLESPDEWLVKDDEFKCQKCKKNFIKGWSDEDALKELENSPWNIPEDEIGVLCDDCFKEFKIWFNNLTAQDHRRIKTLKHQINENE